VFRPKHRVGSDRLGPWIIAVALFGAGFAGAALAKPRAGRGALTTWVAIALLLALPWCAPRAVGPRAVVTMSCVALFVPKLVDALVDPAHWHGRPWREWVAYLPGPCVLVHRGREMLPVAPPTRSPAKLLARAIVQIAIGLALLAWAIRAHPGRASFWLDHAVILLAAYLFGFDGMFLLLEGVMRAGGSRIIDQTRDPILAATPADFWRRYNREAGRFFCEDVFKPIGGLRYPRRAIVVTFLVNGALHEYLAWNLVGSIQGYQFLFFALHGGATALTFPLRPRGALARVVGTASTMLFLLVTSVLFFASVRQLLPWYSRGPVLPW
jgi:hypothetical protein